MRDQVISILNSQSALFHKREEILSCRVPMVYEGFRLTREILYQIVERKTVLYLSGGNTPKELYKNFVNDKKLFPGAFALIDERYGLKMHNNSNEKMIAETGLLNYAKEKKIPFYSILQDPQLSLSETAMNYDMTLKYLFNGFPKSIGILGIGKDGHTAGIAGNRKRILGEEGFQNPIFADKAKDSFVSSFSDLAGPFKERVTLTFLGLSKLDFFIVLVFGDDKKHALKEVFQDGSEEEIPARFFRRPDIAKRTLFITDQKV